MFQEIKNRDAWASIRGFVYQVDATIYRWLTLNSDEVLELEKGEDIDVVARGITLREKSRKLEQIKYRESDLSLNQNGVIELLLNFYLHKKANPKKKIFFRFISNTGFVVERPAIFSDGTSGIEMWVNLSLEDVSLDDWRIEKIQKHLETKIETIISKLQSDDAKQHDWTSFKKFIGENSNLVEFIKNFEWSLNLGGEHHFSNQIKNLLETIDKIDNVEITYARLFLYVFKLLTKKGVKQLDVRHLDKQLNNSQISSSDENLFELLSNLLEGFAFCRKYICHFQSFIHRIIYGYRLF